MEKQLPVSVLEEFPQEKKEMTERLLQEELQRDSHKIIVLDDDPTGVQTVHDVSVYTDWSEESIRNGFLEKEKLFYILTNSRSFSAEKTEKVHREIAERTARVSKELGRDYLIISRGDSTLRGHYPLETETIRKVTEECLKVSFDGEIICPYFREGGRFTIGDVHYVKMGERLVPAGQTEFAKDRTFGYHSSNLKDYIEEHKVTYVILTVPPTVAQAVATSLEGLGIKGILNLSSTVINVSEEITVHEVDLNMELETLFFYVFQKEQAGR